MRSFIPNKKEHNSDYFKIIDSETKAYILGYLVADGSIEESVRKDRPSKLIRLRFGCVTDDDEILKLIQKEIAPNNKLRYYQPSGNRKQTTILQICDKELIKDLKELYNIKSRKTYDATFEFPNIQKSYERHFIRGFIDGDGSIGDRHFSMICNSPKFAEQIKNKFLEIIPNLKWVIYKENRKFTPYWSLHFSFNNSIKKVIFDYLYKDANTFLTRKRNKALNAVLNADIKKSAQCNA